MSHFDDSIHTATLSEDGSYTAYSKEYDEHYHSTRDGALYESLTKHVIPALELQKDKEEITILDICFGLGFNTLATLLYLKQKALTKKVTIYSPELDSKLVESLNDFTYPKEFDFLKEILRILVQKGSYEDEFFHIEVFLGDAREYILNFEGETFDIVYQDAFSPSNNPMLWTKEYFSDISRIIKKTGILTSYSMAFRTRLALYENNFNIYINSGENFRDSTIASKDKLLGFKQVNMEHKISCNKDVVSLRDKEE